MGSARNVGNATCTVQVFVHAKETRG